MPMRLLGMSLPAPAGGKGGDLDMRLEVHGPAGKSQQVRQSSENLAPITIPGAGAKTPSSKDLRSQD